MTFGRWFHKWVYYAVSQYVKEMLVPFQSDVIIFSEVELR